MCCQEKWGGISGKYFFNPFPVSLKILLKFSKMNHRYHIDMSFHSIHENHYKKARVNFQCDHEAEVNMSRENLYSSTIGGNGNYEQISLLRL